LGGAAAAGGGMGLREGELKVVSYGFFLRALGGGFPLSHVKRVAVFRCARLDCGFHYIRNWE
jgi:hypothetical protein